MNKSESIANLAKSLAQFQGEIKQPLKDKANPFFKSLYVPLESVVESITKVAPKYGLSFVQYPINNESKVGVITIILHESGEYMEFDPIFAQPAKNDPQAVGSTITYLKRYSLSAVFGITSDQDDDANHATGNEPQTKPQSKPQSKPQPNQETKPDEKIHCSCGTEINAAVKTFSEKKFGKPLCMDCQKKVSKGA